MTLQHSPNYDLLTELEQRLITALAYTGKETSDDNLNAIAKKLGTTQKSLKTCVKELDKRGMLRQDYYYWGREKDFLISPEHHLRVLCWVCEKHLDWAKSPGIRRSDGATELMKIAKAIVSEKTESLKLDDELYYVTNIVKELASVSNEQQLWPMFCGMSDSLLEFVLKEVSTFYNANSNISEWKLFLDVMDNGNKERTNILAPYYDKIRINIFISEGKFTPNPKGETTERGLMMLAIREAYARHIPEALAYLEKALKAHNKATTGYNDEKNVLSGYITNFFMMLIYALDGSMASRKKMETAVKKHTISETCNNEAAYILGQYFKDAKRYIDTSTMTKGLVVNEYNGVTADARQMLYLLMQYFELHVNELHFNKFYRQPDLSPENYIPANAILRHELSPYLPICQEEKDRLRELFGGAPLLHSIYRKKEWEAVLEEILQIAEQDQGKHNETEKSDARLVYELSKYSDYVKVREQKRLKSGAWSAGKELNPTSYQRGDFYMDEHDKTIWMGNKGTYQMPTAARVIINMVGQKRVLNVLSYYPMQTEEMEIREEKAFLTVSKEDGSIKLGTNLPSLALLDMNVPYHIDWTHSKITYFPMTEKERTYFRKLLSIKSIPLEAEETLNKIFPAINNKVEIHSDFIEGGTQLEEVEGESLIALRITPRSYGQYHICFNVHPMKEGKLVFLPGQGQNPAFDEQNGKRVQVKRHLRQERDNARIFKDWFEDYDIKLENYQGELSTLDLLEFMDFARSHEEQGYLEWTEGERLKLAAAMPQTWNVSLKKNAGWFDLEGELTIDDETVISIAQLLDMMGDTRSRFIRLDNDKYLSISEQLRKQLQKIDAVASRQHGKAVIPAVGMAVLGEALSGELEITHPKALDELRTKIKKSGRLQPEVPERLNATLRDYQLEGFQWMTRLGSWEAGACLADDMGLGKTVQTIAVLLDKAGEGPSLVVAPASVVPNWRKELNRFAPTLNVSILNEATDRKELVEAATNNDVIVSTYGLLVTEEEIITRKQWNVICLDEAHAIKNRDTKTSGVAMQLEAKQRIILTGTPIQNHLGELWNLFQFINPGLLGSYDQFNKKYILPISQDHDTQRKQQLKRLVQPFMLRRTKQEVVEELPDKTEITRNVQLTDEEMAVYEVIRRKAKEELEELEASGKALNINALAEITRLRLCACTASLAQKGWSGNCAKLDAFEELASDIYQSGNRTLVFSQFTSFLEMAAQRLKALKIPYFYLDGSTPMRKRTQMVEAFQKGECPVFLISLKAGGLGLNLTGANYVIHLDPWWNPAIEQQATDRAYRIGQRQNVTVYHLISSNTIEEKILRLHDTKRDLASSLLEGTDTSHKITAKQLLEMLEGAE